MAMFKRPGEATPFGSSTEPDTTATIVGPSVSLEGDLSSQGPITIQGRVKGKVTTKEHLEINEGAEVEATVEAGSVRIAGMIRGNITAHKEITLTAKSKVFGNLNTEVLTIEAGASFNGECHMGKGEIAPSPAAIPEMKKMKEEIEVAHAVGSR